MGEEVEGERARDRESRFWGLVSSSLRGGPEWLASVGLGGRERGGLTLWACRWAGR